MIFRSSTRSATLVNGARSMLLVCLLSGGLTACIAPQKIVSTSAVMNQQNAYIAGSFYGRSAGLGFGFVNLETRKEYFIPFFPERYASEVNEEQLRMMEIPAGTYVLAYWAEYSKNFYFTKRVKIPDEKRNILILQPNTISYFGRFGVDTWMHDYNTSITRVSPKGYNKSQIYNDFSRVYPNVHRNQVEFVNFIHE